MLMKIVFGTPEGCSCHPNLYRGFYVWALYKDGEFKCAGARFMTHQEAFEAGRAFCETLPGQGSQENIDQN